MKKLTIAATLTAALLLTGCTGDPDVLEPGPGPSEDASASASSAPKPPELPEQASKSTDEGAASFAYHWVQLFNFAAITGDTEDLRKLSSGCKPCLRYISTLGAVPEDERPTSAPWDVKATRVHRDGTAADVRFKIEIPDGSTEDVAFELSPRAPYEIRDLYVVEGQ